MTCYHNHQYLDCEKRLIVKKSELLLVKKVVGRISAVKTVILRMIGDNDSTDSEEGPFNKYKNKNIPPKEDSKDSNEFQFNKERKKKASILKIQDSNSSSSPNNSTDVKSFANKKERKSVAFGH